MCGHADRLLNLNTVLRCSVEKLILAFCGGHLLFCLPSISSSCGERIPVGLWGIIQGKTVH